MTRSEQVQQILTDGGVKKGKLAETLKKILDLFPAEKEAKPKSERPTVFVSVPGPNGESIPIKQSPGIAYKRAPFSLDENGNI